MNIIEVSYLKNPAKTVTETSALLQQVSELHITERWKVYREVFLEGLCFLYFA